MSRIDTTVAPFNRYKGFLELLSPAEAELLLQATDEEKQQLASARGFAAFRTVVQKILSTPR